MKNKILFATLFVLSYFLAPAQWANTNKPDADAVLCMTAIGGNIFVGTATGGLGGLFVSPDGGNTWSSDTNGIGHPPVGSITALGSKIFITTYTSVYVSVNNGVSWTPANNGLPNAQTGFIAVQGSIMYVGLGNNGVYRSIDTGATWVAANGGISTLSPSSMAVSGSNIFLGDYGSGVYLSTDSGTSWTAVNNGISDLKVVSMFAGNGVIYAGTLTGYVYYSTDNGSSWTAANTNFGQHQINALYGYGSSVFAGTGLPGGAYVSCDQGINWSPIDSGLEGYGLGVGALAVLDTMIYAGTDSGFVWRRPLSQVACLSNGLAEIPAAYQTHVVPDPMSSRGTITLDGISDHSAVELIIYDITGKELKRITDRSDSKITIDGSGMANGMYFYTLYGDSKFYGTGKFLVE